MAAGLEAGVMGTGVRWTLERGHGKVEKDGTWRKGEAFGEQQVCAFLLENPRAAKSSKMGGSLHHPEVSSRYGSATLQVHCLPEHNFLHLSFLMLQALYIYAFQQTKALTSALKTVTDSNAAKRFITYQMFLCHFC